jgi:PST family polysaccharide transporter
VTSRYPHSRESRRPQPLEKLLSQRLLLVVSLTLPITIACVLFADDLIFIVLGAKWSEAAPIFRSLAPTILIFAMINPMWWLLVSKGLVGRSLRIALVLAPLVMTSYAGGPVLMDRTELPSRSPRRNDLGG